MTIGKNADNTSGEGERAVVPPEIRRWNWGAFPLHWIWGIGNDTYIALLTLIPLVNRDVLRARREGKRMGMAKQALARRRAFPPRAAQLGDCRGDLSGSASSDFLH
ncbi:MAG TPA: hypothetical protein VKX28_13005 [Xanthobacteraceae bacterium]|nr:hypothetical protein [Xanthobacteraceae bacterium]